MLAARMGIRKEGVGALNTKREVVGHEQVKDPVDAVGGDTLSARLAKVVGDIIGRGRFFMACQLGKYACAHACPLLASCRQCVARCVEQAFA